MRSPGWYDDAAGEGDHRWWNGAAWSTRTCREIQERPLSVEAAHQDAGRLAMACHEALVAWIEGRGPNPNAPLDAGGHPVPDLRDAPHYDPHQRAYEALVIRRLTDIATGAPMNIGVLVVASDLAFIRGRFLEHWTGAHASSGAAESAVLRAVGDAFDARCQSWCDSDTGYATALARPSVHALFSSVVPDSDTGLEAGPEVIVGVSGDLEQTLQDLFRRYTNPGPLTTNRSVSSATRP